MNLGVYFEPEGIPLSDAAGLDAAPITALSGEKSTISPPWGSGSVRDRSEKIERGPRAYGAIRSYVEQTNDRRRSHRAPSKTLRAKRIAWATLLRL
jgi:hypothetical protein